MTGTERFRFGSGLVPVRFRFGSNHVTSFFARLNAALSEFDLKNETKTGGTVLEPFFGSRTGTVRFRRGPPAQA